MSAYPADHDIYNANLADLALSDTQAAVRARLRACPWFAPVKVITAQEGNLLDELEKSLGTMAAGYGQGMCIVVSTPSASDNSDNVAALDLDPVTVSVDIYTDPLTVNSSRGVKRTPEGVALNVLRLLKGWTPAGFKGPLAAAKPSITDIPDRSASGILRKNIALTGSLVLPVLRLEGEDLFPVST